MSITIGKQYARGNIFNTEGDLNINQNPPVKDMLARKLGDTSHIFLDKERLN